MAYCGLMISSSCGRRGKCAARATCRSASTRTSSAFFLGCTAAARHSRSISSSTWATVADDRHVDLDVLVDRGGIDVDVDLVRARRERIEPAGDAVVEARADADHHVAIVHREVGFVGAVHAEHAEPLRIGRREGAEPHQRRGDGKAGEPDQLAQQLRRPGPELTTPPPV